MTVSNRKKNKRKPFAHQTKTTRKRLISESLAHFGCVRERARKISRTHIYTHTYIHTKAPSDW